MPDKQSAYVLPENVSRSVGRDAQRNNIMAAKLVADIVKTTLGPRGMDKMLVDSSGNIIVTNDGVTILEEMEIDHPAAKMIVEIAKTQELEVGDGTTTAAMLAGKLLENAERLLDKKIHPTIIVKGYKLAAEESMKILNEISIPLGNLDILRKIVMTAMTGKGAEGNKEKLADLVVDAVSQISEGKDVDLNDIKIEKIKGGRIEDSELIKGVVISKERANAEMPSKIEKARILLVDFPLELRNPEMEARVNIFSPEQLEKFIEREENYLRDLTDKIMRSGANVVFCQKGIDDVAQYYLAKSRILACRRVPKSDMEKIARAISGKIISNVNDISLGLGYAERVDELKKGEDYLIYITGCKNPRSLSIIIRGGSSHILDEVERAIQDGLGDVVSAIKIGRVVAGGGAVEMELAKRLRGFARTLGGREQLAVEEFANSLESIPEALAENAGLDQIQIITELRKKHELGGQREGLNLFNNLIVDTFEAGIIEPLKVKTQAISSASEVANMILRIDDVLISKSRGNEANKAGYEGLD